MGMSENTATATLGGAIVTPDENDVERTYVRLAATDADTVTIPAGTYVVGDPCYTVPDACWGDWLDAAGIDDVSHPNVMAASLDGHPIVGIGTAYGDGGYKGSDGFEYSVDAGMIGLVPLAIAEGLRDDLCTVVEFTTPVECSWITSEGTISLGHITIKTDPDPEPIYCIACGRPSDCDDYCTWGCGYGEDDEDDIDEDDIDEDEDEE